jgi:hypothetical protein
LRKGGVFFHVRADGTDCARERVAHPHVHPDDTGLVGEDRRELRFDGGSGIGQLQKPLTHDLCGQGLAGIDPDLFDFFFQERERELMDLMRVDYDKQVDEQSVPKNLNMSYSLRREYELKGGEFYERKKMLFGVPTNKFYLYFRSVLLREPWDDKDLTFRLDGMNAIWQPKRE